MTEQVEFTGVSSTLVEKNKEKESGEKNKK